MKTFFTLLSAFLLSASLMAADHNKSAITVRSADQTDIRVIVDGRRYDPGDHAIFIRDLDPGMHDVRIFKRSRGSWGPWYGRRFEMVYKDRVNLRRSTHLFITVDRNGRVSLRENRIGNRQDKDDDRYDRKDKHDRRVYGHRKGRDDRRGYDDHWEDIDYRDGYASPMNDREFSEVLRSIDREWLEANKFKSASQVVRTNSLSTAQVKQVLLLFNFEQHKLNLAKEAYPNTVDKRNYDRIYDVFSYRSSREELERYIRNFR